MLSDREIIERALQGMIRPFVDRKVVHRDGHKIVSYGLSSYGYDFRLGTEFDIFTDRHYGVIDPKDFSVSHEKYIEMGSKFLVPPRAFVLAHSVEYFKIPRDIIGICMGKSTYARCGIIVNVTALEPEWEGQLTVEISNTSPLPVYVYPEEGIAQLIFFQNIDGCEYSYADNFGKYMGQIGITHPKV